MWNSTTREEQDHIGHSEQQVFMLVLALNFIFKKKVLLEVLKDTG